MRRALPLSRLPAGWRAPVGLSAAEVLDSRGRWGANDIVETSRGAWRELAIETSRDPMLWFLAGTALLYLLVGQRLEGITLLFAILPLVGMDLFLHRRTQASTAGLSSRLASLATVCRDGRWGEVAARELVPGDLVRMAGGEPLPADGILIDGDRLQADESILTGEAFAAVKQPIGPVPEAVPEPAVDHVYWGFAGTRLLSGDGLLRVVFTGGDTLYGEIVRSAVAGAHPLTPLQRAIRRLVGTLVLAAGALCLIIAWARLRQGHGWLDALVSAVTLASAALPEEFPVVFTFFLGIGVYRLAQRHALVRRAVSVENVGRVTCICSDKTGTITEGRLTLAHLVTAEDQDEPALLALAAAASRRETGDPLDAAVLDAAGPSAVTPLATFPFTETRRLESAVVRRPDGRHLAVVKGALESVLARCDRSVDTEAWNARMTELAETGHKVIACAWRPVQDDWAGEDPDQGYGMAGLLALEDPVRHGVATAVAECRAAGIHTIMVTGDHPLTARAVALEVGLGGASPRVVTGDQVEALAASARELRGIDVIARAAPAQKLALVRGLQAAGEIVAVTGDGVNDVPALKAADVGIAMGGRGTRSAREVAAIVLLDDDFTTIVRAMAEGRQLFANLRLAFIYLLVVHVPLVLTAALVPLAGYPLLYLPAHIVWLELVIHPTALLVFQELQGRGPLTAPVAGPARFFSNRQWAAIGVLGLVLTAMVSAGFLASLAGPGGGLEHGRSMALAMLTFSSASLTAALSGLRTRTAWTVVVATAALTFVLIQTPTAALLHVAPLHLADWLLATLGALAIGAGAAAVKIVHLHQ